MFTASAWVKPKFHLLRHVTTRHDTTRYLAQAFCHRKTRDVLCRDCRTARRDTLVTTYATCSTRVRGRRHSVNWGGHVHLTFSRSCSRDWCKSRTQKTKFVHASTTVVLVVRHVGTNTTDNLHDKRDTLVTARSTRRVTTRRTGRDVSWRNATSGIWA